MAEGRSGRRLRSLTVDQGETIVLDLLLEVDARGWFSRLELTGPSGMLTLHPEPAGTRVEGNVVTRSGVRPISLPWSAAHELRVAGSPIPEIAAARVRAPGQSSIHVVVVDLDFLPISRQVLVGEGSVGPAADARGLPILSESEEWALEE
ncbi:MAG: hypothetical protein V4515_01755 [Chloroflexota bacterium]